ncbi:MAG: hypothetical protein AAGD96_19075, partial [Chloroflexota bacterium]
MGTPDEIDNTSHILDSLILNLPEMDDEVVVQQLAQYIQSVVSGLPKDATNDDFEAKIKGSLSNLKEDYPNKKQISDALDKVSNISTEQLQDISIDTKGGSQITGDVTTGGSFVGRDKIEIVINVFNQFDQTGYSDVQEELDQIESPTENDKDNDRGELELITQSG